MLAFLTPIVDTGRPELVFNPGIIGMFNVMKQSKIKLAYRLGTFFCDLRTNWFGIFKSINFMTAKTAIVPDTFFTNKIEFFLLIHFVSFGPSEFFRIRFF